MIDKILSWLITKQNSQKVLSIVNRIGIKNYLINLEQFYEFKNLVKPGDAILTYAFGEATSLLQASKFSHVSTKAEEDDKIYDADGSGTNTKDILNLLIGTGRVCIKRPKHLTGIQRLELAFKAKEYAEKDIGYDWIFKNDDSELYCSEYYLHCFNHVSGEQLDFRPRFGRLTITPDDIFHADRLLETIYDSKGE